MGGMCGKSGKGCNQSIRRKIRRQLRRLSRNSNRVVPVNILPSPAASTARINSCKSKPRKLRNEESYESFINKENAKEYSTDEDRTAEVIAVYSFCDNQDMELIDITNDPSEVSDVEVIDTRNRRIRPKAAKGARSCTSNLTSCVKELENDVEQLFSSSNHSTTPSIGTRPLAAKGVRTAMKVQLTQNIETEKDARLPGEVNTYFSISNPVLTRHQLTVPIIRTSDHQYLDSWMQRQIAADKAKKGD